MKPLKDYLIKNFERSAIEQLADDYRDKGYKGSVSITDQFGVFVGAETSHGYMFDRHNYLGVGVGGFVFPNSSHPTFMNVFVDYHNFLSNKASTPLLGLKAGGSHSFYNNGNGLTDVKFKNAVDLIQELGPRFGCCPVCGAEGILEKEGARTPDDLEYEEIE